MSSKPREIIFEKEALRKLYLGITEVAELIALTFGPKGKNVGLGGFSSTKITRDGKTILDELEIKDEFINLGVLFVKDMVEKLQEKSGDGRKGAILILQKLVQEGMKAIAGGSSPVFIKKGLEKGLKIILNRLKKEAIPLKGEEEIKSIAKVSAHSDEEVGENILQAIQKVGKGGVICVKEGKSNETYIEITEGMKIDSGYISPYFCTSENMSIEMEKPFVLICDKKIVSAQEILPLLQEAATISSELLIIADEIESDALSTLVLNKMKNILKVAAIKAPSFGENRKNLLEDLALFTGANFISEDKGFLLKNATLQDAGKAEKITITKNETTIIGSQESQEKSVRQRILQIEKEIERAESDFEKKRLEKRKAKLQQKVAIIFVGGISDEEVKQKKQTYENSLNATRAAIHSGITAGGGLSLLKASKDIEKEIELIGDETIGVKILKEGISAPFKKIVDNAGYESSLILEKVMPGKNIGFNADSEKIEDLLAAKIIDPVQVIKESLEAAVSSASMALLSNVLIADTK